MKTNSFTAMFILVVIILWIAVFVIPIWAFTTVEITAPTTLTYLQTTSVNISGAINISAFPYLFENHFSDNNTVRHVLNITILTKTTSAGAYSILASSLSLTYNASNDTVKNFWNFTATLPEGRNIIRLNWTNVSRADDGSFGGVLSAERIVQIDTQPNFINFSSILHLEENLSMNSGDGTRFDCGPNDAGTFSCSK